MSTTDRSFGTVHAQTISVRRPAQEVFDYLTDLTNLPQWSSVVHSVSNPPSRDQTGPGARAVGRAKVLGVETDVTGEVMEFDRGGRRAVIRAVFAPGGEVQSRVSVEEHGATSLVRLEAAVTVPQWVLDQGVTERQIRGEIEANGRHSINNIRRILEDGEHGLRSLAESVTEAPPRED